MAQQGFPENPNVGDTFKKGTKTYVFQGDKWVIKGDFAGPNPGTVDGEEWKNARTKKTYVWDAATSTWKPKRVSPSTTTPSRRTTTTTAPPRRTTTTTAPPRRTTTTTAAPTTTTVAPTTTTVAPTTTTTVPATIPGDPSNSPVDFQAQYTEAQNYAYGALSRQTRTQRIEFLNLLYAKGFGGATKPTTGGLEPSDIEIAAQFYLYYAGNTKSAANPNGQYITVDDAYNDIKTWRTTSTAGAGTFTPKLDVSSAFRQVMQNDLGRAPTDQEVERFYNAYRGLESGGDAPNLQSAAQSQIEKTMSAESEASSFSGYADVFEQLMRGA
jgi:hypothetical protein